MRVRYPFPCCLNHSTTSVSTRKDTGVLPLPSGMTIRALRQKCSSSSISGASARVRVSPRSCLACNSSSEYRLISSFAMVAYLPCADHPAMLPAPCVDDEIILLTYMSQGTEMHFSVILPVVFSFQHGMGKNERGIGKVSPMFIEVLAPFLFNQLKAHATILYKCIYSFKNNPQQA